MREVTRRVCDCPSGSSIPVFAFAEGGCRLATSSANEPLCGAWRSMSEIALAEPRPKSLAKPGVFSEDLMPSGWLFGE